MRRVYWQQRLMHCAAVAALLFLSGCPIKFLKPGAAPSAKAKPRRPLTLLVLDDPQLGQAIAREWLGRTEEELVVRDATVAEVTTASRLPADVVVFPSGLIGQLAERALITPLEPAALEEPDFDHRDIFDQLRLREMKWGNRTMVATIGSPQLLLAYRGDLFDRFGLQPPTDWGEYQAVVARLAEAAKAADGETDGIKAWKPSLEPLSEGWAGQLLLARGASYALYRDQVSCLFRFESMAPLVAEQPYVRALEELVAAAKAGGFTNDRLTPTATFAALRAGRCVMAIGWPAPELAMDAAAQDAGPIRFSLLPGGRQAFRFATGSWQQREPNEEVCVPVLAVAGRSAAVTSSSSDPQRAQSLVLWLASRQVSQQVSPHSVATTLFRSSHVSVAQRWTGSLSPEATRHYAETLAKTLSLPRAVPGVTIPGRSDYLAALDQAVEAALQGTPAREALQQAAKQWQAITDKLGRDEQRRANARSLGQQNL